MAVNNPFFTKRETPNFSGRSGSSVGGLNHTSSTLQTASAAEPHNVRSVETTAQPQAVDTVAQAQSGSKLTVGPNIKLKGVEITDCDTLVVEGTVEATMDSRVIQITQQGAFHGSAEIDIAEIHGEFQGSLTVRHKLVIHSTGNVSGKIRYGNIVIEEGGQLSGEIEVGVSHRSTSQPALQSKVQAAAITASTAQ